MSTLLAVAAHEGVDALLLAVTGAVADFFADGALNLDSVDTLFRLLRTTLSDVAKFCRF